MHYMDSCTDHKRLINGRIDWFLPVKVIIIDNEGFCIGIWRKAREDKPLIVRLQDRSGVSCAVEKKPGLTRKILTALKSEELENFDFLIDSIWWSRVIGKKDKEYFLLAMLYDYEEDEISGVIVKSSEALVMNNGILESGDEYG